MRNKSTFIVSTVIVTAFVVGMFAGIVSGQVQVARPDQVDAIQGEQGEDAPYGTWTKQLERNILYLHRDEPMPATPAGVTTVPNGDTLTGLYMDYERPAHIPSWSAPGVSSDTENQRFRIDAQNGVTATFDMVLGNDTQTPEDHGFLADMRIYEIFAYMKGTCSGQGSGFEIELIRLAQDETGAWVEVDDFVTIDMATGTPSVPSSSSGLEVFTDDPSTGNPAFDTGWLIKEGERLRAVFSADTRTVCDIAFDTDETDADGQGSPARIEFVADSSRFNTWIENFEGTPVQGLPAPSEASESSRRFQVQVEHVNTWPQLNAFNKDSAPFDYQDHLYTNPRIYDDPTDNTGTQILNDHEKNLRIRNNEEVNSLFFDERTDNPDTLNFPLIRPLEPFRTVEPLVGNGSVHALNQITYSFRYTTGLPEGDLQAEIYDEGFGLTVSPIVTVGLRGFELSSVDGATHDVNAEETTLYRLQIDNVGGDADTYTVTAGTAPSGWEFDVINQRVNVFAGGSAEVLVEVTPPPTAGVGTEQDLAVTVSSSFPQDVDPQSFTFTTRIVAGGSSGAELLGNPGKLEIFPGQQISVSGVRIHNTAPFADTYVFNAVLPAGEEGWSTKITPPSRTVPAASINDLGLTIRAPPTATTGETVDVALQAVRLGATGVETQMTIPVEVVLIRDLVLDLVPDGTESTTATLAPQYLGTTCAAGAEGSCFLGSFDNSDYDRSAVFRVALTNPTPVEDTFSVRGRWTDGDDFEADIFNGDVCQDDSTGNPDWWRVEFGEGEAIDGSPSIRSTLRSNSLTGLGSVTVPPQSTVYRYLEVGWINHGIITPDGQGPCQQAWHADPVEYMLRFQSSNDPTLVAFTRATVDTVAPSTRIWDTYLEPDIAQDLEGAARQRASGGFRTAEYDFRVVNRANEPDNVFVSVQDVGPEFAGWSHHIEFVSNEDGGDTTSGIVCTSTNSAETRWRCNGMGVHDEATFKLIVQPPVGARIGTLMESQLKATSGNNAQVQDDLAFTTKTVGLFSFDVQELKPLRRAAPGADVSLPFEIENTGTEGDQYTISIIDGDANWKPRISSDQQVFIPGLHSQTGFLFVTVPDGAAVGSSQSFRVQVDAANAETQVAEFEVEVIAPGELSVSGDPSNSVLLAQRGAPNTVDVVARSSSGPDNLDVRFDVDGGALPQGWTVTPSSTSGSDPEFEPESGSDCPCIARASFDVTPPANALSTSRVPLLVTATTQESDSGARRTATQDIILSLEADQGVALNVTSDNPGTVLPGGSVTFAVDVLNDALASDTVDLDHTQLPDGWSAMFQPAEMGLGPLETGSLEVTVQAPSDAEAGDNVTLTLFGTSRSDPTVFDSVDLWSVIGFTELDLNLTPVTQYVGPDETATFVANVTNLGNLPDDVLLTGEVLTDALAGDIAIQSSPRTVDVGVNATSQAVVEVSTSTRIPAGVTVPIEMTGTSQNNPSSAPVTDTFEVELIVLDYKARDVDGDAIPEFAVDRNRDPSDGYEQYKESRTPGGKTSRSANLERFIGDAYRDDHLVQVTLPDGNTTEVFRLVIDGDEDGRVDHFIDDSGDGLPNVYWDPDADHSHRLGVIKDVDADNVVDYFVDLDGDEELDRVFNVVTGQWTDLIVRDIDDDGTPDYVVDADGDGEVDADETVLYTRSGGLVTVQKVDVDGDGELDEVFDVDGDGEPDYFVRNGETAARPITLKDVNGDGVEDWLYDSNEDGKDDSYYDPASRTGGNQIDSQASFLRMAGDYWYIPALFVLVLILFVVLIAVTRR